MGLGDHRQGKRLPHYSCSRCLCGARSPTHGWSAVLVSSLPQGPSVSQVGARCRVQTGTSFALRLAHACLVTWQPCWGLRPRTVSHGAFSAQTFVPLRRAGVSFPRVLADQALATWVRCCSQPRVPAMSLLVSCVSWGHSLPLAHFVGRGPHLVLRLDSWLHAQGSLLAVTGVSEGLPETDPNWPLVRAEPLRAVPHSGLFSPLWQVCLPGALFRCILCGFTLVSQFCPASVLSGTEPGVPWAAVILWRQCSGWSWISVCCISVSLCSFVLFPFPFPCDSEARLSLPSLPSLLLRFGATLGVPGVIPTCGPQRPGLAAGKAVPCPAFPLAPEKQ